jgi:hypothetical protein
MRLFRLKVNKKNKGVFATSMVKSPAIEIGFQKFSSEVREFNFTKDKVKYELTGPLMVPNMDIPRYDKENKIFFVYFTEEDVINSRNNFFKYNKHTESTHEHKVQLNNNYIVESWIVEDPETDKSKALGFNVPRGTWMITMKIEDKQYWTDYIESGKVTGFSLEGDFEAVEEQIQIVDVTDKKDERDMSMFYEMFSHFLHKKLSDEEIKNLNQKLEKNNMNFEDLYKKFRTFMSEETQQEEEKDKEKDKNEQEMQEVATFVLGDGTIINLPASILTEPLKVMDAEGNVVGELMFTPAVAESETTEPSESPEAEVENPADFEKVKEEVKEMKAQMMTMFSQMKSEFENLKGIKSNSVQTTTNFSTQNKNKSSEPSFEDIMLARKARKNNK